MSSLVRRLRWAGIIVGMAGFLSGCATVSARKQGDAPVASAGSNPSGSTDASAGPNASTGADDAAKKSANANTNGGIEVANSPKPVPRRSTQAFRDATEETATITPRSVATS